VIEAFNGEARLAGDVNGPAGAPALLLLHSLGTTRELWAPQLPEFVRHFQVIRADLRGHGQSSVLAGDYSIDELGKDALAILDAAGVRRANVCGLSIGGVTAMWLARYASDRVDKIVLANTGARIGTVQSWSDRIALVRSQGLASLTSTLRGRWFTESYCDRHPAVMQSYAAMLLATEPQGYVACAAALRDADLSSELPHISAPALVIAGDHDPAATVADAERLRDGLPRARLVRLPAAHLSNVEQPDAFSAATLDFLNGHRHG
jgi:3-oxoadipate enol-lactonase